MLIRSQDKKILTDMNCCGFSVANRANGYDYRIIMHSLIDRKACTPIGEYSTEKKAIKVLDMICDCYKIPYEFYTREGARYSEGKYLPNRVFNMPSDDEVEV